MREATVARSYAEALFELAQRHEGVEAFGDAAHAVASLCEDSTVRTFLDTPRISSSAKKQVLERALGPAVPRRFLTFLKVLVDKRRQRLLVEIAKEYRGLLDRHHGRRHVEVTVAQPIDDATLSDLAERMSIATGATVVPHVKVAPRILGGIVIRDGDTVYDGSLQRRLGLMRRRLLAAELPSADQNRPVGGP